MRKRCARNEWREVEKAANAIMNDALCCNEMPLGYAWTMANFQRLYADTAAFLSDNTLLDASHWSQEFGAYLDYGLHTEGVKLERPKPNQPSRMNPNVQKPEKTRIVTQEPHRQFVNQLGYVSKSQKREKSFLFVLYFTFDESTSNRRLIFFYLSFKFPFYFGLFSHRGNSLLPPNRTHPHPCTKHARICFYMRLLLFSIGLFPLLLELLEPTSQKLDLLLSDMEDPSKLFTSFGLRSLSRSSSLYMKRNTEHDAPYWRGPIWINVNFLAIRALKHYAKIEGPYQVLRQTWTWTLR